MPETTDRAFNRTDIPREFLMDVRGVQAVLYKGLLELAHRDGLTGITTEILQFPNEENRWTTIVRATIHTSRGVFTGIGDANESNVGRMIGPHTIRMAETRAKGRAFRDALSIGYVMVEELNDLHADAKPPPRPAPPRPASQPSLDDAPLADANGDVPFPVAPTRSASPLWKDVDRATTYCAQNSIALTPPPDTATDDTLKAWLTTAREIVRKSKEK